MLQACCSSWWQELPLRPNYLLQIMHCGRWMQRLPLGHGRLLLQVTDTEGGRDKRAPTKPAMPEPAPAPKMNRQPAPPLPKKGGREPTRPRGVSKIDLSTVWGHNTPAVQLGEWSPTGACQKRISGFAHDLHCLSRPCVQRPVMHQVVGLTPLPRCRCGDGQGESWRS